MVMVEVEVEAEAEGKSSTRRERWMDGWMDGGGWSGLSGDGHTVGVPKKLRKIWREHGSAGGRFWRAITAIVR